MHVCFVRKEGFPSDVQPYEQNVHFLAYLTALNLYLPQSYDLCREKLQNLIKAWIQIKIYHSESMHSIIIMEHNM